MKLRNKKTGEIKDFALVVANGSVDDYSLTKLNEEWEDAPEEPKKYWYMDYGGRIKAINDANDEEDVARKEIGNYFETKEEAEKAVEKLKAWKLLKDECDFKFDGIIRDDKAMLKGVKVSYDRHQVTFERMRECMNALHILFGGEE